MRFLLFFSQTFKTPEAIVLSLFLVIFQGLLPKRAPIWTTIFTSDALKHKASDMSRFLIQSKNSSKRSQKKIFSGSFQEIFHLHPFTLYDSPPIFFQIVGHMKIHNRGKFHEYSISGCQVIDFQFFCTDSASMKWPFLGGFLVPNSAKHCLILMKLSEKVCFYNL